MGQPMLRPGLGCDGILRVASLSQVKKLSNAFLMAGLIDMCLVVLIAPKACFNAGEASAVSAESAKQAGQLRDVDDDGDGLKDLPEEGGLQELPVERAEPQQEPEKPSTAEPEETDEVPVMVAGEQNPSEAPPQEPPEEATPAPEAATPANAGALPALSPILFPLASYHLTDDAKALLDSVVLEFKKNPRARLLIRGHTDETGSDKYNRVLSRQRATEAVGYLVSQGVNQSRILVEAVGGDEPAAPGGDRRSALNRRVEMIWR
jgi:large repetitive protein